MNEFVSEIQTVMVGGGANMDFVLLKNGQVLGIDSDSICLYDDLDDYYEGRDGKFDHVQTITWGNINE